MPFGAFVQVGEGIEGLVHISEMAVHHVEAPEQVVTPGEELWVKIIDIDLDRRRISLSIKQAAEGGVVAAEYQEHYGEHAYDEQGNYIGPGLRREPSRGRGRGREAAATGRGCAEGVDARSTARCRAPAARRGRAPPPRPPRTRGPGRRATATARAKTRIPARSPGSA